VSVQRESAKALEEAQQASDALKSELEARIASTATELAEAKSGLQAAEAAIEEHTTKYANLQGDSSKALEEAQQASDALKFELELRIASTATELAEAQSGLQAAEAAIEEHTTKYANLQGDSSKAELYAA
jgi:chromosome segregation ATPase